MLPRIVLPDAAYLSDQLISEVHRVAVADRADVPAPYLPYGVPDQNAGIPAEGEFRVDHRSAD